MKKIIYVAEDSKHGGDSFDVCVTFDKDEAINEARRDRMHQSDYDRRRCSHSVSGYEVDVQEGQTAEEAWREYILNSVWIDDPVEFEEITIKADEE